MGLRQKVTSSYSFRKYFEILNRFTYTDKSEDMKIAIERFKSCPNKKSPKRMSYEMKELKKYWNCHPFQYIRYDLYRSDNNLSLEELKDFVPEYFFYRLYLPYHTDSRYKMLADDKSFLDGYLEGLGVKHPLTLAKVYNGKLYDKKFSGMKCEDLTEMSKNFDDIFVKPTNGRGGYGIQVYTKKNNEMVSKDGTVFDKNCLEKLLKTGSSWIIQPGIKQADILSEIYSYSINTFRIATENMNGEPKILFAELRMGRGGNRVDNISQGAIGAILDVETGRFFDGAVSSENDKFYSHPDTKYKFSDYTNPQWDEIKSFVIDAASRVPHLKYVGWDIALTPDGPVVVEANIGFAIDVIQPTLRLRPILNISDPMFYWRNHRSN